MKPDLILANSPYGKPGIDITKHIMENFPDANYAMLNTRSAFKKYYDKLACQFVQIGKYELGTNQKLDWGVEQAILLATNGWTEVIDNRKRKDRQPFQEGVSVGTNYMDIRMAVHLRGRTSHLVGAPTCITRTAWNHRERNATLVQAPQGQIPYDAYTRRRSIAIVQVNKSGPYLGGAMDRHTANVTDTKPTDVKLRNGYIYVSFETFEEACECAIDIISWKNPTDSHYRCVMWGFVCGLVPHERFENF